ncbi:hypothetical protein [Ramlibacter pallidus]|uniref:PEGA domain-containing protein n=1 Tax=Ramlibacter pallidus TaxID=2780087 RepID=A0ABR9S408_9BURK|nr:hypothetical protein [Ramlibacter pallidus]MBE7368258.1 hypothetical protein [Ramlibacter pallidus]
MAASVLFLRLRSASQDGDGDRAGLPAALRSAADGWDPQRRVVLEAPDGFAIVGDIPPLKALEAARRARAVLPQDALGVALHHGSVHTEPGHDGLRVAGEGLDTAEALAAFPAAHPILASQAFRDALERQAPRAAEDLRAAGEMMDAQRQTHPLHVFDPAAASARRLRRNLLAGGGVLAVLGLGWAARMARLRYEAARRPAVIRFDIRPDGEVHVDGQHVGTTPPLVQLALPAGPHAIEVRHGKAQPLRLEVHLQPGEEMELHHVFPPPAPVPRRAPRPAVPQREPTAREKLERAIQKYKFW